MTALQKFFNRIKQMFVKSPESQTNIPRAVGVIVLNAQEQVLLLQRSVREDSDQGKWSIVGGKVAAGEDFVTAAIRQVREEIALAIQPTQLQLLAEQSYSQDDRDRTHQVKLFLLVPRISDIPRLGEPEYTTKHAWVSKIDLHKYPLASYTEDDFKLLGWT